MESVKRSVLDFSTNSFGQGTRSEDEIEVITCTRAEFEEMLNGAFRIVVIRRTEASEFLFADQKPYIVDEDVKWVSLNMQFGLESRSFIERLDRVDRLKDRMIIEEAPQ